MRQSIKIFVAVSRNKEEPKIINDLVVQIFVEKYLNSKLADIVGSFDKFNFEILHYYENSVRWVINIYYQGTTKKIIAVANPGIKKNYLIAKFFLENDAGVLTYKPLFYDENLNLFFYEYVDGRSLRELVELDKISFDDAEEKILSTIEILKKMSLVSANIPLEKFDFENKIPQLSKKFSNLEINWTTFRENLESEMKAGLIVHGDFQAGNIICNSKIAIIDWDRSFLGDNAYDIGSFFAHTDLMFEYHYGKEKAEKFKNLLLNSFSDRVEKIKLYAALNYLTIANFLMSNIKSDKNLANKITKKAERCLDE